MEPHASPLAPDLTINRDQVLALLAAQQGRPVELVSERVGSLHAVWLLHSVQQQYGVDLTISNQDLARMVTVTGAVEVLRTALASLPYATRHAS